CFRIAASSGLRMPVSNRLFSQASGSGRSEGLPNASQENSSVITPVVSVPVLSLHRTSMLPRFCIAANCLTMTFSRAMETAPLASVTDVIIGKKLGRQTHRQGNGEEEGLKRIAVHAYAQNQDEQHPGKIPCAK